MNIWTPKTKSIIQTAIAFLLALFLVLGAGKFWGDRDRLYLALAGPTTSENASDREMVRGVRLYLDRLNKQGGIDGKKVKLLVFDDRNNPNLAVEIAEEIANSSKALAVLGHLYSSTSLAAGEVYRREGIPAISASATADGVTQNNDWYFRTIFNNSLQASFIANYSAKILQHDRASIIYSDDSYGKTLQNSFAKTFQELGGEIQHQWAVSPVSTRDPAQKAQIIQDLIAQQQTKPGIIFCATHNNDVVDLIAEIKRQKLNYQFIGADSLGNSAFAQSFQQYAEEKTQPGYFTDGIYAVSPIIFDVASQAAQQFRNEYIKQYQESPSWTAANYYDAAQTAVQAIKRANLEGDRSNLKQQRQKVQTALKKMDSTTRSFSGLTGNVYFDPQGDRDSSIYIGTFLQQEFISAFIQLQPLDNNQSKLDLAQLLDAGRIFEIDGRYMYKTNIVYAGIDINEIRSLDEKTSSYLVDFYLWFRYQGDIAADKIEFTNYGTDRMDSGDKLELDEPIEAAQIDGVNYRLYRVKADFKEEFRFDDYPFDRQKLAVRFRHINLTNQDLIYVVDVIGMRDTVAEEVIDNWQKSQVFSTISDWRVTAVDFFSDLLINDSTLGNPKFFSVNTNLEYSRFNTVIEIERNLVSFSIKNLLPLLFFVAISYLLLFLPFENISVEAVSGTLLAIVFFHLSLLESLPEGIGYVVALDYGFYVIYTLIGLELLLVTIGNKPEIRNNQVAIKRLVLIGRIIFPIILIISAIALLINYKVFG